MARYFGIDQANTLLAEVRPLLEGLRSDRDRVTEVPFGTGATGRPGQT